MDRWDGFGYVVFGMLLVLFLPFMISLFGRDARLKGAALALCIGALLLTGSDSLQFASWVAACACAGLAIRERLKAKADAHAKAMADRQADTGRGE